MALPRHTPTLGATGLYVLSSPWVATATKVYTCKAIRLFQDLDLRGIDPLTLAYTPYGGTEANLKEDREAGAAIISLIADDGTTIFVPDTRIVSYPNQGTYSYKHVILSISLGAVSDSMSLDWLSTKLKEDVTGVLGIDPEIHIHQMEVTETLSNEEYDRLEASRAAKITSQVTYASQIASLQKTNAALVDQLDTYTKLLKKAGII